MTLLRNIYEQYAKSVGLGAGAQYITGAPLRPVVPLDVGTGGIFILGAYPSARFAVINGVPDVPVADNVGPFEEERWFDGVRVRSQPSAKELRDLFLEPLGLKREKCWISDLVKVFLFKPGHVERYKKLGGKPPKGYTRERFDELARRSLPWIVLELRAAQPRLLVTLGAEVAGILRGVDGGPAQTRLLKPEVDDWRYDGFSIPTVHCAHPGILMRAGWEKNRWPRRHREEFIPSILAELDRKPRPILPPKKRSG